MDKLYEVREVRKYSGLSRKDLFELEEVIPPKKRKDNYSFRSKGYKLYDQEGLEKLCLAGLFRTLGATPKELKSIFGAENLDRKKLFTDLLKKAKKQKQLAEDIIVMAKQYLVLGNGNYHINPFVVSDLHKTASMVKREMIFKKNKKIAEKIDKHSEEYLDIIMGFNDSKDSNKAKKTNENQIKRMIEFASNTLSVNPNRFLFEQIILLNGKNEYSEYIDNIKPGLTNTVCDYFSDYIFDNMYDEIFDSVDALEKCFENGSKYDEIKTYIKKILTSIKKWMGMDNSEVEVAVGYFELLFEQEDMFDKEFEEFLFKMIRKYISQENL